MFSPETGVQVDRRRPHSADRRFSLGGPSGHHARANQHEPSRSKRPSGATARDRTSRTITPAMVGSLSFPSRRVGGAASALTGASTEPKTGSYVMVRVGPDLALTSAASHRRRDGRPLRARSHSGTDSDHPLPRAAGQRGTGTLRRGHRCDPSSRARHGVPTRFARDTPSPEGLRCAGKYDHFALRSHLKSLGISLRSASEPIDNTSTGKLMEGVLASFAQFDNDVRSDRTRAG